MKRDSTRLLILSDQDMNCDPKNKKGIEKMSITDIGLSALAIKDYDMVIYEGEKGTKILKNKFFKKGIVV